MVGWSGFGFRCTNPDRNESSPIHLNPDADKILNFADFLDLIKPFLHCKILSPAIFVRFLVTDSLLLAARFTI
jgi:hypothetical protein